MELTTSDDNLGLSCLIVSVEAVEHETLVLVGRVELDDIEFTTLDLDSTFVRISRSDVAAPETIFNDEVSTVTNVNSVAVVLLCEDIATLHSEIATTPYTDERPSATTILVPNIFGVPKNGSVKVKYFLFHSSKCFSSYYSPTTMLFSRSTSPFSGRVTSL